MPVSMAAEPIASFGRLTWTSPTPRSAVTSAAIPWMVSSPTPRTSKAVFFMIFPPSIFLVYASLREESEEGSKPAAPILPILPDMEPSFQEAHLGERPIRDLGLTIAGTLLEPVIAELGQELE